MDRYKSSTRTHTLPNCTCTQQMVAITWLDDHQGRPSVPTNSLHKLHIARYQVHQLQLCLTNFTTNCSRDFNINIKNMSSRGKVSHKAGMSAECAVSATCHNVSQMRTFIHKLNNLGPDAKRRIERGQYADYETWVTIPIGWQRIH